MAGRVQSRQKRCRCGGAFIIKSDNNREVGIECTACGKTPTRYHVVIYAEGRTHRISRDLDGYMLDSYARAHRLLEKIRGEIDAHTFRISNYIPKEIDAFRGRNLIPKWFDGKGQLSRSRRRNVALIIKHHMMPVFENIDCRKVTAWHIEQFMQTLTGGPSTRLVKLKALRDFCGWLYRVEILARMPVFPVMQVPEAPLDVMRLDERDRVLEYIPRHHQAIFRFMVRHPLRPGEVCALRVGDVDTVARTIHVRATVDAYGEVRPRKNKRPYYVPLSAGFDDGTMADKLPGAFLFMQPNGRTYRTRRLWDIWAAAMKRAGAEYLNLYNAMRHTTATDAARREVPEEAITRVLGNTPGMARKYIKAAMTDAVRRVVDGDGAQVVHIDREGMRK